MFPVRLTESPSLLERCAKWVSSRLGFARALPRRALVGTGDVHETIVSEDGDSDVVCKNRANWRVRTAEVDRCVAARRSAKREDLPASKFKHMPRTPDENSTISSAVE